MKRILFCLIAMLCMPWGYAQNDFSASDDAARISLTPYIAENLHFNAEVSGQLKNKINRMLTENGLAGIQNGRFILTANIDVLSEDIVTTTSTFYQYELRVNFYVGDGIEGNLFASSSQKVKGLGETKADAYIKALKNVKPGNAAFKTMMEQGKQRILEYYNAKCGLIIQEAKTYAARQEYDEAIFRFMSVPEVCADCYAKCMEEAQAVFQVRIDKEGEALYARAAALWGSSQNADGGMQAGLVLAEINPSSRVYEKGVALLATIAERVRELDEREYNRLKELEDREWDLKVKEQQDAVELKKANIQAMRDIGVAYGNNQQPTTYNIGGWW